MDNIIEPDNTFLFDELTLGFPVNISSGSLFTKIYYKNKPLFIQTPKSLTKQGFIKTNKKIFCDLLFDNNDNLFISWFETLENKIIELLYIKSSNWFENTMEKNDIESFFNSPIKLFKSGKNYLLRTNVKTNIIIYNENQDIVLLENINNTSNIISILEIKGIKFSNKTFSFDFEMKQCMIVSPDPFLNECFIKSPYIKQERQENNLEDLKKSVGEEKYKNKKEIKIKFENNLVNLENLVNLDNLDNLDNSNNLDIENSVNLDKFDNSNNLDIENLNIENLDIENLDNLDKIKLDNSNNLDDLNNINFDDDIQVNKIEKILNIIQKEGKEGKERKEGKEGKEYEINLNNFKVDNNKNIKEEKNKMNIHFDKSVNDKNDIFNDNKIIANHEISNINFDDLQNIPEIDFEDLTLTEIKNTNTKKIKEEEETNIYYKLYKEAKKKVKEVKNELKQAEEEVEKIKKKYYINKNIN